MARQEGPRAAGLLPDPARRRHAARRHRHPGRARAGICRQRRAARPDAAAQRAEAASRAATTPTTSRTGCSRARTTWCPTTSPRRCCSGTRRASRRRASPSRRRASTRSCAAADKIKGGEKTGLADAQLRLAVLAADEDERRRSAVARPQEGDLQHAEGGRGASTRLAEATKSGAINPISWTGRWVEPNEAFATGNVGMLHAHAPAFFWIKGKGPWINGDTLGAAQMPGNWATPNSHGLGISKGSQESRTRLGLREVPDRQRGGDRSSPRIASVLTGNKAVDKAHAGALREGRSAGLPGAEDPARAHRQDVRQLAAAATTAASRTRSGRSSRAPCSAARTPRPRWPTPSGASAASCAGHEYRRRTADLPGPRMLVDDERAEARSGRP